MQTGLYVFEVNYENPLTTEEISTNNNKIFPNPTNGVINLNLNSFSNVELFNIQGDKVFRAIDVLDIQIQTNIFPNGIYFLKINSNSVIDSYKISIQ